MEFDKKAKEWDNDPLKIKRAREFAEGIVKWLPESASASALELGCGTGQVSLSLHDKLGKIFMVDSSEGMIRVLEENIKNQGIENMHPLKRDVLKEGMPAGNLDLIYSLMTLHHIGEIDSLFRLLSDSLRPGGMLFIGDLEKEDGSFHDHFDNFSGHNGFDKLELLSKLEQYGFCPMEYKIFFHLEKKSKEGISSVYPLFFMALKKQA